MNPHIPPFKDPIPERRVGVIVPPANPAVEPELRRLLDQDVALYVARLPVFKNTTLAERNQGYIDHYPEAIQSFGSLQLQAILIAITGPFYRFGIEHDRRQCARYSEICGVPVKTMSLALYELLSGMKCRTIYLVSPYPDWLTKEAIHYWQEAGFKLLGVDKIRNGAGEFSPYTTPSRIVTDHLRRAIEKEGDAILITGTGLTTIQTLLELSDKTANPLISSNLCGAWWLLKQCQLTRGSDFYEAIAAHHLPTL